MKTTLTVLAALAALVAPGAAFAATYQYVSVSGDVLTIVAPDPDTAIRTAPAIAPTSGVLLIDEPGDMLPKDSDVPIDSTPPVTP
jgi:hypothetical protein